MMKPRFILAIAMILTLTLCGCTREVTRDDLPELMSDFSAPQAVNNQTNHYVMLNGEHYIDLSRLSSDGTLDKIADNVPPGNPYMATIYSIATDGEFIFCSAQNMQSSTNYEYHFRNGIYRINVINNEILQLHEWERPNVYFNNYSIFIYGDYVYFFIDDSGLNRLCKVKKDGSDFEVLSDIGSDAIYSAFFIYNDEYYYLYDGNLYLADDEHLDGGTELYGNITRIDLYNGYFYFTVYNEEKVVFELFRAPVGNYSEPEFLFENINNSKLLIKDDIIYYLKYNPEVIGTDSMGNDIINATQGVISTYDLATGESGSFNEGLDIAIWDIFNVSDRAAIVIATSQEDLIAADTNGVINQYYIIDRETNQYYLVDDKTLLLQGT